jgi:hypothetical protein
VPAGCFYFKQGHRLVGQHAAGDRNRRERRLGGNVRGGQHDLIDLGGELRRARRKHQPADVAPQDRAHAHRTRFTRGVERRAAQRLGPMHGQTPADRHHLAMRGRVAVGAAEIAAARDDRAVTHDHGAERIVGLPRFLDRIAHEPQIGGGIRRKLRTRHCGQHGRAREARDEGTPAR